MNFARSRLSIGRFLGQRCRQATETWSYRGMCNKPQDAKAEPPPAAPAYRSGHGFKLPGHRPSNFDRKCLVWSGRFKTADQIPEVVSVEMIDAARNKVRVKICYLMIVATLGGCLLMVYLGKNAAARHESLTSQNMERKARWRDETRREREAAAALAEKAQ
ncbi:protein FAM162B [Pempheris klunzingeri]|uniref:protein FAM162B n=1 Tax=Pempheris klunzingeri TaxID=3127111 RepID=UPI00397FB9F3